MSGPPLRFVTLGTADATPQANRGPSSTFVQYESQRFLVDIGSGALQKLLRAGCTPSELDAVFLTHAHVDHLGDLLPLLFGVGVGVIKRDRPLTLYASAQTFEHVRGMHHAFEQWTERKRELLRWVEVVPHQQFELGALRVHTGSVHHTDSSVAFKWETPDGRTLAIPGDTGTHPPLIDFVREVDGMIIECGSDPKRPVDTHLTPQQLSDLLGAAQPKHAWVVHLAPALYDQPLDSLLKASYAGRVTFPSDLDSFVI